MSTLIIPREINKSQVLMGWNQNTEPKKTKTKQTIQVQVLKVQSCSILVKEINQNWCNIEKQSSAILVLYISYEVVKLNGLECLQNGILKYMYSAPDVIRAIKITFMAR